MFHTFLDQSKQKRFIIQAECVSIAIDKIQSVGKYYYQLSAHEPVAEINKITAYIPTTILYSDGNIQQLNI